MAEFHSARQVASVCEDMLYERVKLEAERLDWLLEKSPGPIDVKSRDGSRLLGPDLKITTAEKYVVPLELKYFGRRGRPSLRDKQRTPPKNPTSNDLPESLIEARKKVLKEICRYSEQGYRVILMENNSYRMTPSYWVVTSAFGEPLESHESDSLEAAVTFSKIDRTKDS